MRAFEDSDDPSTMTRRRPFSASRNPKIKSEGDVIAHVGRPPANPDVADLQLDLTAILLGADGNVVAGDRSYCVFYNNHLSPDRSTRFLEDTADGSEFIKVHLKDVDEAVRKIIFGVSIYDAAVLGHTFGSVTDAHFWIEGEFANRQGLAPIHSDNLSQMFPTRMAVVIGELYRSGRGWDYRPLGGGHTYTGLDEIGGAYGVNFDA